MKHHVLEILKDELIGTIRARCPKCDKVIWTWENKEPKKCERCGQELKWQDERSLLKNETTKEQPDIVRCKDCEFGREVCGNIECHKPGMREFESEYHPFKWFCADGKCKKDS